MIGRGGIIISSIIVLLPVCAIDAGAIVGLVLGNRGVALAQVAAAPHEEEEDERGEEEDAASDADAEADFEACVGGRWRGGASVGEGDAGV